ncbi:hypothetical protein LQ318_04460 [Aliifodinibius salicampi]|uniref:DUF5683 domain-containing protein n=1 Tax=Fodinibius salicampi TaxID=1920655 RepID=A0ABT3PWB4_9BACT|nr:hypothetical protein [Fodinibius salicampi]MCW9712152.1 hypothetical protein [Fodinibius salicampi]
MKNYFIILTGILLVMLFTIEAQAQQAIQINQQQIKSVSQARNIAVTNTVIPLAVGIGTVAIFENPTVQTVGAALTVYGLATGPSTGNFYAEDYGRGFAGLALRGTGMVLMKNATSEILGSRFADAFPVDNKEVKLTDTKILIGGALIIGSTIYNIMSVGKSVEKYQEQRNSFALGVSSANIMDETIPLLATRIRF